MDSREILGWQVAKVENPDSVTHFYCPDAADTTHHLRQKNAKGGEMVCTTCGKPEAALRLLTGLVKVTRA